MNKAHAIAWVGVLMTLTIPSVGFTTDFAANPDNYGEILKSLQPGDTLRLAPGQYTKGLDIFDLNGYQNSWIVIEGPIDGARAIFTAVRDRSTVQIKDSSFVRIFGLEFVGEKDHEHHAVELLEESQITHHIDLEELSIHGFVGATQSSAVITHSPTWDWTIRLNTITDMSNGLIFGNRDASNQFIRARIEQNAILRTHGYALRIHRQVTRPTVTGVPRASAVTFIKDNVFSRLPPPPDNITSKALVLLEHLPEAGFAENDSYNISGNFFYENSFTGQSLVEASGNVHVHNNIFVNRSGDGLKFGAVNNELRDLACFNNTIIVKKKGIQTTNENLGFDKRVTGNAIFAEEAIVSPGIINENNLIDKFGEASQYLRSPETLDYYPKSNQLRGPSIDLEYFNYVANYSVDFNGELRDGRTRGAYLDQGNNTGWRLGLARKNRDSPSTPDAGIKDSAASTPALLDASVEELSDAGLLSNDGGFFKEVQKTDDCSCHQSKRGSQPPTYYWLLGIWSALLLRRRWLVDTFF